MSTTVEYNGSVVATIENGNKATLPIKDLKMKSDIVITVPEATDSPLPIEVATEAEMTALLTSGEVGGVYKYTGTTGTYENGALYVLENNLITFTIDGTSYEAEDGMTWGEWCNSEYNTSGFGQYGPLQEHVSTSERADYYICLNSTYMLFSNTIVEGTEYVTDYLPYGGRGSN